MLRRLVGTTAPGHHMMVQFRNEKLVIMALYRSPLTARAPRGYDGPLGTTPPDLALPYMIPEEMQNCKRLQKVSTMDIKSFIFNIPHSCKSDCFRDSKVLCGLVQALDSKERFINEKELLPVLTCGPSPKRFSVHLRADTSLFFSSERLNFSPACKTSEPSSVFADPPSPICRSSHVMNDLSPPHENPRSSLDSPLFDGPYYSLKCLQCIFTHFWTSTIIAKLFCNGRLPSDTVFRGTFSKRTKSFSFAETISKIADLLHYERTVKNTKLHYH
ncbi:hypothetical protein TNCV_5047081, partial [Trichonephila clavipes]